MVNFRAAPQVSPPSSDHARFIELPDHRPAAIETKSSPNLPESSGNNKGLPSDITLRRKSACTRSRVITAAGSDQAPSTPRRER